MGDGLGDTDDDDGGPQAVAGSGEPPGSETHAGAVTGTCGTTCAHGTTRADAPARAAHDATGADVRARAARDDTGADVRARAARDDTSADVRAGAAHDATYADIPVGAAPGNHATFCAKANSGADKRDAAANPHR